MPKLLISVVICTHNREKLLKWTLESVVHQTFDSELFEVIVVDNASTDGTKGLIEGFRKRIKHLRYVFEPTLGVSYARNKGWQSAETALVAYLDSDAVAQPDWLEKIVHVFQNVRPTPGLVGGQVDPIWETPPPKWIKGPLIRPLGLVNPPQGAATPDIEEYFVTANSAYPREVLEKHGGFCTRLGRVGTESILGFEEFLMNKRILDEARNIYYAPEIKVRHFVRAKRLNKLWFLRQYFVDGCGFARTMIIKDNPSWKERLALVARKGKRLLKKQARFFMKYDIRGKKRAVLECFYDIFDLGDLWGLLTYRRPKGL